MQPFLPPIGDIHTVSHYSTLYTCIPITYVYAYVYGRMGGSEQRETHTFALPAADEQPNNKRHQENAEPRLIAA